MFGFGSRLDAEAKDRASQVSQMILLIIQGLKTKTYDEFVAHYSRSHNAPDTFGRFDKEWAFQMTMSPTCWYEATIDYGSAEMPSMRMLGGGDDYGVFICGHCSDGGSFVSVSLECFNGSPGKTARRVVKALQAIPGYRDSGSLERGLLRGSGDTRRL